MTDAAVPVTQSAVEAFTKQYLRRLGCNIDKQGNRWTINTPGEVESELLTESLTLVCGDDVDEETAEPLHPESPFFQTLLSEASERTPAGKIALETDDAAIQIPEWLQESEVEVTNSNFTPYYDRTAVVVLFRVSIETVSEYQTDLLRAVAVDSRTEEFLPALEQTFLDITSLDPDTPTSDQMDLSRSDVEPLLDTARQRIVERVQDTIDEIHQEASRAADAEVEEFRQMQQQRIEELAEEQSKLSKKIDDLSERISSSDENERVDALKQRKDLKADYEDVDAELSELRQRRDKGFPDRQREIRTRHALDVRVKPLTITEVEYERGEIELELAEKGRAHTMTVGYGSGVGVTEAEQCASCGNTFSQGRYLETISDGLRCSDCILDAEE
jgi:hypothetical protein